MLGEGWKKLKEFYQRIPFRGALCPLLLNGGSKILKVQFHMGSLMVLSANFAVLSVQNGFGLSVWRVK
jgi:hypothetical protein